MIKSKFENNRTLEIRLMNKNHATSNPFQVLT